jgi:integrase
MWMAGGRGGGTLVLGLRYVFPLWTGRYFKFARTPVSQITHEDIAGRLPKAPAERNHALVAIKIFLTWAQKPPRRYIPHNPCEGMMPTKRPSRKRVLSDIELSKVLRAALEAADNFSRIVGLLVCTGLRPPFVDDL